MRNLLVLLDQVQTLRDRRVVLVPVLADLKEHLDHVLHALVDRALVQHRAEALIHAVIRLGRRVGEERPDLAHEADGDLDAVVRGLFEQEDEDLQGDDLVCDGLVAEVGDEGRGGVADGLAGGV